MASLALYFIHGWGYDRSFWNALHENLSDIPCYFYEAGYFGDKPDRMPPALPYLAIGHSAGVMTALYQNDPSCRGLIAFNGFPRFSFAPTFPQGVPDRILQRMSLRLEQAPQTTLNQFRALCGDNTPAPSSLPEKSYLQAGLAFLRDKDTRTQLSQWEKPLINIIGSQDPLSPARAGLTRPHNPLLWKSCCWEGGHLLPITHKAASLQIIRETLKIGFSFS